MFGESLTQWLTLETILQSLDTVELVSGRNALYVRAEAKTDLPVTWYHWEPSDYGAKCPTWQRTYSRAEYIRRRKTGDWT